MFTIKQEKKTLSYNQLEYVLKRKCFLKKANFRFENNLGNFLQVPSLTISKPWPSVSNDFESILFKNVISEITFMQTVEI